MQWNYPTPSISGSFKDTRPLFWHAKPSFSTLLKSIGFAQPSVKSLDPTSGNSPSTALSASWQHRFPSTVYTTADKASLTSVEIQLHTFRISITSCLVASPAHFQSSSTFIDAISCLWNLLNLQCRPCKTVRHFATTLEPQSSNHQHELHQKQSPSVVCNYHSVPVCTADMLCSLVSPVPLVTLQKLFSTALSHCL